jgi:succinate-acetate transporter protein
MDKVELFVMFSMGFLFLIGLFLATAGFINRDMVPTIIGCTGILMACSGGIILQLYSIEKVLINNKIGTVST